MIVFDARHIENCYSGLGRYSASLAIGMSNVVQDELIILVPKQQNYLKRIVEDHISSMNNVRCCAVDIPLYGLRHHFLIGMLDYVRSCSLYVYPHFDAPLTVMRKVVYIIHDTFVLDVKGYLTKNVLLKKIFFLSMHNLQALLSKRAGICVSESTRADIVKRVLTNKKQIGCVLSGLIQFDRTLTARSLRGRYILYVGDRRPHKNLPKMIDIFQKLRRLETFENYSFLIVGSQKEFGQNVERLIELAEGVESISNISDSELNFLYKEAEALFFLTKYEGFGLPILEAWSWGTRIITSDIGAAREIAPKGSLLLDPEGESHLLVNSMKNYLQRDIYIDNPNGELFSWDRAAKEILDFV